MEIIFVKPHNWKSSGNAKIQNKWLKAAQRHITKSFNAIMEESE